MEASVADNGVEEAKEDRARVVRISRPPSSREKARSPGPLTPTPQDREGPVPTASAPSMVARPRGSSPLRLRNQGAVDRSLRLYLLGFVLLPSLLFAFLVGLVLTSPYAPVRSDLPGVVYLLVILALFLAGGYWFTLGRSPRSFRFDKSAGKLRVRYFEGSVEELQLGPEAFQAAVEVYATGFFAPVPTELVEFHNPPYRPRRWIVERRLLDGVAPRHPPRKRQGSGWSRVGSLDEVDD